MRDFGTAFMGDFGTLRFLLKPLRGLVHAPHSVSLKRELRDMPSFGVVLAEPLAGTGRTALFWRRAGQERLE